MGQHRREARRGWTKDEDEDDSREMVATPVKKVESVEQKEAKKAKVLRVFVSFAAFC